MLGVMPVSPASTLTMYGRLPILKEMRHTPLDDNSLKERTMKVGDGRSVPSGKSSPFLSRVIALLFAWALTAHSSLVYPAVTPTPDASAAPLEPAQESLPAGSPEVQPVPSVLSSPHDLQRTELSPQQAEERPAKWSPAAQPQAEPVTTAPTVTRAPADQDRSGTPEEESSIVDTLHGGVTYGFLSTATWLDSFFGNERYEAEISRSQIKVRFEAFREGSTGMDYRRPNFDLRLVLPQMRHMTRLAISGDPNVDTDTTTVQPGVPGPGISRTTERNLTTSLQYVPVETAKSNFSIRAGIKLHNGKLDLLAGPRYRYLIPLDPWALRFTQEFVWSSDMRWQSRSRVDFERSLPHDLFFRTSMEGLWSENVVGYTYNLNCTLQQPLDRNRALQYEWVNIFQTYPTNGLVEELLVFRYRQRFWRDWLFLEIAPQYRFPRDRSFEATPGILFRLEMVFGDFKAVF
jgi:hypothetical protein